MRIVTRKGGKSEGSRLDRVVTRKVRIALRVVANKGRKLAMVINYAAAKN